MILDYILTKFREGMTILVQPTDNTFAQFSEVLKRVEQAVAKVLDFTKEAEQEDAKAAKKAKKTKKTDAKEEKEEADASAELESKLLECYALRDELQELSSLPVTLVAHMVRKVQIQTDTSPELQQTFLKLLLLLFSRFLETVNPGDERNTARGAKVAKQQVEFLNPREKAMAKKMLKGKEEAEKAGVEVIKGKNIRKTVTRTLTRRR